MVVWTLARKDLRLLLRDARAMIILGQDRQLRARYSAAALSRVMDFTADRMVERTEDVYRSIGARA